MTAPFGTLAYNKIETRFLVVDAVLEPTGQRAYEAAGIVHLLDDVRRRGTQGIDDHTALGPG